MEPTDLNGTTYPPSEERDPGECRLLSETLARIGDKWTVLVVELLCESRGAMRFNEIRRAIDGISQRMLTLTLRSLERDGLVRRTVTPTSPPRVDYALTSVGATLSDRVRTLIEWSEQHRDYVAESRVRYDTAAD